MCLLCSTHSQQREQGYRPTGYRLSATGYLLAGAEPHAGIRLPATCYSVAERAAGRFVRVLRAERGRDA